MFALAVIAETDLISALPRRFAAMHAPRFGVVGLEAPLPLGRFRLNAVAPKSRDDGYGSDVALRCAWKNGAGRAEAPQAPASRKTAS